MKPHVSHSQLDMYPRCGEQYRRRYLEGEIIPPGIALMKGTGFHHGASVNFKQKTETRVDLKPKEIVEAAVEGFKATVAGGYMLTPDEEGRGANNVIGDAIDDLVCLADLHARKQAPDYQPVMVEQRVRVELPNCSRDLLGVIDLADDQGRVTDFKTSGKSKNQQEADTSVQLTVYAAAYHAVEGHSPKEVRLDTAVQSKHDTKRQLLVSDRGPADFRALAFRINAVVAGIEAGVFVPATPGSWSCSERFCGYWNTCPYVNSERKALEELK